MPTEPSSAAVTTAKDDVNIFRAERFEVAAESKRQEEES